MHVTDLIQMNVLAGSIEQHDELLAQDQPVMLHLPGALTAEYADLAAARIRTLALKPYEATTNSDQFAPIPKLGPALFEYHDELSADADAGMRQYFEQAAKDATVLRNLFDGSGVVPPLDVLHEVAGALLGGPVTVAEEGDHQYFSGVVRDINGGALPHYDDASVDTPHLAVGQTDRQLSILLYLTDFLGGDLISYEKKPTIADNSDNVLAYGYAPGAVQGSTFMGVVPAKGSIVAFNPRYLHSVAPILDQQRRITVSAFVGRDSSSGKLISWS